MTRKHFEGIAECLNEEYQRLLYMDPCEAKLAILAHHSHVCHIIASRLSGFNPNFNYNKFIKACGIEEE